ncbi:MAG: hypothetical protein HKL80_01470 [Acidimicrobiales bacterium]|nr:hypothetical protein [Acidimicrobiales bacterium]
MGKGVKQIALIASILVSFLVPFGLVSQSALAAVVPSITSITPNTSNVSGGINTTITGSGFTGATSVTFGSTNASGFTVVSDTEITLSVPQATSAGTVDVTVTTPQGSSVLTSSDKFTYTTPGQITYTPITPIRICDTRSPGVGISPNQCNSGNGTLQAGSTIDVVVAGESGIPANAISAVLNVTVTNPSIGGYLTVYPSGELKPPSSNVNFVANESIPNLVQVSLGAHGAVSIYNLVGSADVIVDVEGYSTISATPIVSGQFVPLSPSRICDTRPVGLGVTSNQCDTGSKGTVQAGGLLSVNVANIAGVPSNASALVANVTATNTTSAGYLTVYGGASRPTASNLNFSSNQSVANRVIVPIDPSTGEIYIYNFMGSTDVIVDVNGYYTGNTSSVSGTSFSGTSPVRICDTRPSNGTSVISNQCDTGSNTTLQAGGSMNVKVRGVGSVPTNAVAVVLNVTTTNSTTAGFFTLYPEPATPITPPVISDVNFASGETRANVTIVKVGANDSITVFSHSASDVVIDVMGWYSSSSIFVSSLTPSQGPIAGGTSVAISGVGFSGATAVNFGSTPATSFSVTSDTSITATSPASPAGNVDVTVVTASGVSPLGVGDTFGFVAWNITNSYPAVVTDVLAIACPSSTNCYAVAQLDNGSKGILSTSNAGATWNTYLLSFSTANISAITCSSATTCIAYGTSYLSGLSLAYESSNGGATWNSSTFPYGPTSITNIACTSSTNCFAVGSDLNQGYYLLESQDSGLTWTTISSSQSGIGGDHLACTAPSNCILTTASMNLSTSVEYTTDNGTTWSTSPIPQLLISYGVACISSSTCIAIGIGAAYTPAIVISTDSGMSWSSQTVPSSLSSFKGITCDSAATCYVWGNDGNGNATIISSSNGANSWVADKTSTTLNSINDITCGPNDTCYANGVDTNSNAAMEIEIGSGTSWSVNALPSSLLGINGVACNVSNSCWLVGSNMQTSGSMLAGKGLIFETSSSGSSWSGQNLATGISGLNGISCPSVSECYVSGYDSSGGANSIILHTTDGGTTWSELPINISNANLSNLVCPQSAVCLARNMSGANSEIIVSTNSAVSWSVSTLPVANATVNYFDCSGSNCYASAQSPFPSQTQYMLSSTDDGQSWSAYTLPSTIISVSGLSCVSSTTCYAIGQDSQSTNYFIMTTNGGSSWQENATTLSPLGVNNLACDVSACYVSAYNQYFSSVFESTSDAGTTWTIDSTPAFQFSVIENCSNSDLCEAVGINVSSYFLLRANGGATTWSVDPFPSSLTIIIDVSCPASNTCYGVAAGSGTVGSVIVKE